MNPYIVTDPSSSRMHAVGPTQNSQSFLIQNQLLEGVPPTPQLADTPTSSEDASTSPWGHHLGDVEPNARIGGLCPGLGITQQQYIPSQSSLMESPSELTLSSPLQLAGTTTSSESNSAYFSDVEPNAGGLTYYAALGLNGFGGLYPPGVDITQQQHIPSQRPLLEGLPELAGPAGDPPQFAGMFEDLSSGCHLGDVGANFAFDAGLNSSIHTGARLDRHPDSSIARQHPRAVDETAIPMRATLTLVPNVVSASKPARRSRGRRGSRRFVLHSPNFCVHICYCSLADQRGFQALVTL
jgi:hypothetical protein